MTATGPAGSTIQNVTHLAAHAALPAPVRHPVPRRFQRQSVQERRWCCSSSTSVYSRSGARRRRSAPSPAASSSSPSSCFSALSGQLADARDKAQHRSASSRLAEILIMLVGGAGLLLAQHPADARSRCFAMGVHSTFFGPIKYAILPQHLQQGRGARRHRPGRGRHLYRDPRRHHPRRRARVDARPRRSWRQLA